MTTYQRLEYILYTYIHLYTCLIYLSTFHITRDCNSMQKYTLKMQTLNLNVDASNTVGIVPVMLNKGAEFTSCSVQTIQKYLWIRHVCDDRVKINKKETTS